LAIGTTPVVQHAKEKGLPSLYFTNLISARPLFGPAGAGSLATVINGAMANKDRMAAMDAFFDGVGTGDTSGIWQDTPQERPEFRKVFAARLKKAANAVDAGEAVGT
jgi:3,8-divinyl chlorophyllide a/chlorophyllide a reductase subunit Y